MIVTESTTDTQEQVEQSIRALGFEPETTTFSNEPQPETPAADTTSSAADEPLTEQQTGDEAQPAAESETAETSLQDPADKPDKGKGKGNLQKRFDELTAQRMETQRQADEQKRLADERATRIADLERQLEENRKPAEPKPEVKAQEPPKADPKPEPKAEDFEDFGAYIKALTAWSAEQITATQEAKIRDLEAKLEQRDQQRNQQAQADSRRVDTIAIGQEKYSDWDAVAQRPETAKVQFSPALQAAMEDMEPEACADTVYYLVSHPEEAKALFEATNHAADAKAGAILRANRHLGAELARIQIATRQTAADPAKSPTPPAPPQPKKVTQAPPPITPVKGGAHATTADPHSKDMTFREYADWHKRTHPN